MIAKAPDTSAVTAKNSLCDRHMKAAEKKMAGPTLSTPNAMPATVRLRLNSRLPNKLERRETFEAKTQPTLPLPNVPQRLRLAGTQRESFG